MTYFYHKYNEQLRSIAHLASAERFVVIERWQPRVCWMEKALKNPPQYNGVVFRGVSTPRAELLQQYHPGRLAQWRGVSSTSTSPSEAWSWGKK
eukprot:6721209-Lingulodinium_polyedra.AAC.1